MGFGKYNFVFYLGDKQHKCVLGELGIADFELQIVEGIEHREVISNCKLRN